MSVFDDLLSWSTDRPLWQRDAMRRIVQQGQLSAADLDELFDLCLSSHTGKEAPVSKEPLSGDHIPIRSAAEEPVFLRAVLEVAGVNALAPGQTLLFASDGLTVVFGFNGAGKSGYARILRALCRARHRGEVLPDAFASTDAGTPSALVRYGVGTAENDHRWRRGQPGPPELARVSFFDSQCAPVHVNDANEVAFVPPGLDVLPALASACQSLAARLEQGQQALEASKPFSLSYPAAAPGTAARRLLAGLTAQSPVSHFETVATLSPSEVSRRGVLRRLLQDSEDVADQIVRLRARLQSLRRLRASVDLVSTALGEAAVGHLAAAHVDAVAKRSAARVAAAATFTSQPLTGVGDASWQALWSAARRYSLDVAYPAHEFPNLSAGALCPLCQQELGETARQRLGGFEAFVKNETERLAEGAERTYAEEVQKALRPTTGLRAYSDALPNIDAVDVELRRSVKRFLRFAWRRQRRLSETDSASDFPDLSPLPESPDIAIRALEGQLNAQLAELAEALDQEANQRLRAEQSELDGRAWLATILDDVRAEIDRLGRSDLLAAAKRDTVTTGITMKSSELTDRYVSEALRERMTDELVKLGARHLQVHLESAGGAVGMKRFRVGFQDAARVPVGQVLSEGEFRCVALAAFLAELSMDDSQSAIVLDDPVSSLDQRWRRQFAERLGQVSTERQVIVFTHDLQFLSDLAAQHESEEPTGSAYVFRGPSPGMCVPDLPWQTLPVKRRIGFLKAESQLAEKVFRREGEPAYAAQAQRIYGLLREAWERGVEELLLNQAVSRFDRPIQTQRLKKLVDISREDIDAIEAGMTKCSRFMAGHDAPAAGGELPPKPEELMQDVKALEDWVASMRSRRD